MDEYIKREDALDALMFELAGSGYQSRARDVIRLLPTADVAPRADFEALKDEADRYKRYFYRHDYDEMIAEAKAEVAMEIFEKIEKHLFVIAPIEEFDGWARIQLADIMRLKNKYTEAEPPKGE